jgi:hypothetical protein
VTPERLPFVFTRTQAHAAGLSDRVLQGPRVQRVFRGVYARAGAVLDVRLRARAALLIAPSGAVAARQTAAVLLGGVVPTDTRIHLRLPSGRMRVPGIIDRSRSGAWSTARIGGVPVTTAEDTVLDLAAELGLVELVVLGDALVGRNRTTPAALVKAAEDLPGQHAVLARRAAGLVRAGVDSPMETRLRMLLVLAGLPEPVVNHVEHDDRGWWVRRFDLAYPSVRVAVEYDGRQHAESDRQWQRDVDRREELDNDGWRIVVVLAKGIYREPDRTLTRVVTALRAHGLAARITSQEWRVHFATLDARGA